MTRLALLLIALLLPLQFAWGAAAAYCQHEASSQGAGHFGHHEHVHSGELGKSAGGKLALDNDCGVCHGSGSAAPVLVPLAAVLLPATEKADSVLSPGHPSVLDGPPERPQWTRLA